VKVRGKVGGKRQEKKSISHFNITIHTTHKATSNKHLCWSVDINATHFKHYYQFTLSYNSIHLYWNVRVIMILIIVVSLSLLLCNFRFFRHGESFWCFRVMVMSWNQSSQRTHRYETFAEPRQISDDVMWHNFDIPSLSKSDAIWPCYIILA